MTELEQLAAELRTKWTGGEKPVLELVYRPGDYERWEVASYLLPEKVNGYVPILGGETPELAAAAGRRALKTASQDPCAANLTGHGSDGEGQ